MTVAMETSINGLFYQPRLTKPAGVCGIDNKNVKQLDINIRALITQALTSHAV